MSNYSTLKGHIDNAIYQNDTQDISGTDMNSILKEIVDSFGAGYLYMGVATPSTDPSTPDQNVFYIAGTEGTYTNFGGITVAHEVAVLKYNGAWSKQNTGIKFVSVSQNTSTGHTDITIGSTTTPVASVEEVSQLGQKVGEFLQYTKFVDSSGNPYNTNSLMVAIPKGSTILIKVTNTSSANQTYICFFKSFTDFVASGYELATGYTGRVSKYISSTYGEQLVAPSDANYFGFTIGGGFYDNISSITVNGEEVWNKIPTERINANSVKVDNLSQDTKLKIEYFDADFFIANGAWQPRTNGRYVEIPPNSKVKIITTGATYYTMLKSMTGIGGSNTFQFATGYTDRVLIGSAGTTEITAPADAKYLVVNINANTVSAIKVYDIDTSIDITIRNYELTKRVIDLETFNETALSESDLTLAPGKNIADPANIQVGKAVVDGGGIQTGADWDLISIPVTPGQKITFGGFYLGRGGYWAFYNGSTLISSYYYADPNGTQNPVTVTVPEGANILYFDIKTGRSPADPYDNLMANLGESLLPYEPYKEFITKINGIEISGADTKADERIEELEDEVDALSAGFPTLLADLPVSADGSGLNIGDAYINSSTGVITVKLS